MSSDLPARLIDVSQQMDPTLAALVRTIAALSHNNAVLLGEVRRLTAENERLRGEPSPGAAPRPLLRQKGGG
jgi:regulator of replication initiation timing